ncbi:AGAP002323-PA-like protein [Anopheles sinensis]|uniref:AGAP002323-PA-like protein n=1 Tax=Anopheles sinensis TaxID=74873 RepID=A0A084VXD0_ANOSI|nr:AGAP002323-PA-like protein [Anopheles sinensis]
MNSTTTTTVQQRVLSKIVEEDPPSARLTKVPPSSRPPIVEVQQSTSEGRDQLRHCFVPADENGCLGLHLSRTPWDPYPWVSGIVEGSCADLAGVRVGDCVLEANGEDLLGLKVVDIAKRVRSRRISRSTPAGVGLLLWNSGFEKNSLNPQSLSRFANCLQGIAGLLECPICLEIIRPPSWQCNHGHLICSGCRSKTTKCPICREVLGRGRCIVADKLFHYLVQTLGHEADQHHRPPMDPKSPTSVSRRLPLMLREFQRHPTLDQHQPHKHAFKLKANTGPNGTPPALSTQPSSSPASSSPPSLSFHCPSGQPCPRMKSQHDILIHLQKAHQTSVVQYYVTGGDTVDVTLTDVGGSSLPCVVLLPNGDTTAEQSRSIRNQLFFVTKFRPLEQPAETLCWLWHLSDDLQSSSFQVQLLDDRQQTAGGSSWQGRPVPLEWGCQEVLRSKRYARLGGDTRTLRVRIMLESNDRTSSE